MIEAILFDLDGTIVDSELAAIQALLDCTKQWGVPLTREDASTVAGKKWEVAFDLLYRKHPIPLPMEEASTQVIRRFQEIFRQQPTVVPGVVDAIHDFSRHFDLALVSGSHRADVLWALQKLKVDHLFQAILGAEDYPGSKPSPDGYAKALGLLGVRGSNALVFEDSEAGILSAEAAGIRAVAITSTNHFGHDQSRAHAQIPHFEGINADWVKKLFP
jgi:HAD superfamily hydrolase (TIGR01509 family)